MSVDSWVTCVTDQFSQACLLALNKTFSERAGYDFLTKKCVELCPSSVTCSFTLVCKLVEEGKFFSKLLISTTHKVIEKVESLPSDLLGATELRQSSIAEDPNSLFPLGVTIMVLGIAFLSWRFCCKH